MEARADRRGDGRPSPAGRRRNPGVRRDSYAVAQTGDRELAWLGGVGAVILALVAGVESAGAAGGFFATRHPVVIPLPAASETLVRLTRYLGASAWPAIDRRWLPATMAVPLSFGMLVAVACSAIGF